MFKLLRQVHVVLLTTVLITALASRGQTSGGVIPKMKPSLSGATGWINTPPLNLKDLHGKVVLIDFWTYTCINWRRTLPYIREWASKYKDQGLVVIGVHTPEFSFEKLPENIHEAISGMNIAYPVAIDSETDIWQSFQNEYWPALYLIDAKGKVRYHKFGEGDYEESEQMIQRLLKETVTGNISDKLITPKQEGIEVAADWNSLGSPENYLGYFRTQGFASPETVDPDKEMRFSAPAALGLNQWALSGAWTMKAGYIHLNKKNGSIVYRFHARDLHLIMAPAMPGTAIKFRVLIDGRPPGVAHGLDVDSDGNGTITAPRMYQLIRQQGNIEDKIFQIEFPDGGVDVYDFTFG